MKVLFITRGYPSKDNLMNGNYESVQAKALARRGVNVSLICVGKIRSFIHLFNTTTINSFEDEGVHVFQFNPSIPVIPRMWFLSYTRLNDWVISRSLYKVYTKYIRKEGRPDIIHAHIISIANYCKCLLKKEHIPFVITEHWSVITYPAVNDKNIFRWAKMYFKADQVLAVSNKMAESLKNKFNVNSYVVGNMVDNRFFSEQKKVQKKGFTFVSIGSLLPIKAFDILIKSFAKCEFSQDVKLKIVGDGEKMKELQFLIKQLNVTQQVYLLGLKTPDEVNTILGESDCCVLSSHIETFGIVAIEALARGLPVVATKCGGPEDIINNSNGILVAVDNIDELAKGMRYVYSNISSYDSEKIKRECYDRYSEETISSKILAIYNNVILT